MMEHSLKSRLLTKRLKSDAPLKRSVIWKEINMEIQSIVVQAFDKAKQLACGTDLEDGALHRERSRQFVEQLRLGLAGKYSDLGNIRGFSKHKGGSTLEFGMSELLYDVAVLEYDSTNSGKSNKELFYITRALWLVESELDPNKREALYDFNKLVVGASENLLFVGPVLKSENEHSDYLRVLADAAKYCSGNLFLALIPRPSDWDTATREEVTTWVWAGEDNKWVELFRLST